MKKSIVAMLLGLSVATSALAGDVVLNDANKTQVRSLLNQQGYEVGKIKLEDGMYEAYAKKDGQRFEVFRNGEFEIVKTKRD